MSQTTEGTTLIVQGRIVWVAGKDVFSGKGMVDQNTKQPIIGPDGQQKVEYGFGLAVAKVDPQTGQQSENFTQLWNTLHQEAYKIYPSGQLPNGFAFKYKDGDNDVDNQGQSYSNREGYAGHLVISCTTRIPPKFFVHQGGNNILVNTGIKCGDYVNVQVQIKAHPPIGQGKAGLYINPSAVQLAAEGKEIINAPSGDQIFGQNMPAYNGQVVAPEQPSMPNVQVPTANPTTPTPAVAPSMPGVQAPPQAAPHYGVLPQTHQPANTQVPPMAGMPSNHAPAAQTYPPAAPTTPAIPQAVQPQQPNMPGMPPMPGMPQG